MIALITPTGGRQKQISLCAEYMKRQTYEGQVLWVIVDDCVPTTTDFIPDDFRENWVIVKVFPEKKWRSGMNTQARNLREGIKIVKSYKEVTSVFIIEDDDYYTKDYLTEMVKRLEGFIACGETNTIYLNVNSFSIRKHNNTKHSSLFQTAFVADLIPVFQNVIELDNLQFIDVRFWRNIDEMNVNLFKANSPFSIGMKGIKGRPGIGKGHEMGLRTIKIEQKIEGMKLFKSLLGMDYLKYL